MKDKCDCCENRNRRGINKLDDKNMLCNQCYLHIKGIIQKTQEEMKNSKVRQNGTQ